jgi:cullin-4
MTSLIRLPALSDAFESYKPSKNAHTDFLSANALGKRRDSTASTEKPGLRVVRLSLKGEYFRSQVNHADALLIVHKTEPSAETDLANLLGSIKPLLAGEDTKQAYHTLSSTCHRLVLPPHSLGQRIYSKVKQELENSVAGLAREWRGAIMSREQRWLARLDKGWSDWEKRVVSPIISAIHKEVAQAGRIYCPRFLSTWTASTPMKPVKSFPSGKSTSGLVYSS